MNTTLLMGLAVLELLARSRRPLSLTQIGNELGMGKSNVHRLMHALAETRFVVRDEKSRTYAPSIKLWELGSAVLASVDLRRHAQAHMQDLMERTGQSVELSVLDGIEVVHVHKIDSASPVRVSAHVGPVPSYCVGTGKAQLAFAPAHVVDCACAALKRHTRHTITDRAEFLKDMQKVRRRGYATNHAEWREGVWEIAAPVLDARGFAIAAVGVCGPASGFRKSVTPAWVKAVTAAAGAISDALGSDRQAVAPRKPRFRSAALATSPQDRRDAS
jgi:DNA-binding IclR family transcriptional regulator